MRVLLLGADGMLGRALAGVFRDEELIQFTLADLDITEADRVRERIVQEGPDVIINAAAYMDVDLLTVWRGYQLVE